MLNHYLGLAAIIFAIGVTGVMVRRNVIVIFMSIELMLNSVNLTLLAFSRHLAGVGKAAEAMSGHGLVILVMTVAAAEAAVGLAIVIAIYRRRETVNVEDLNLLKW